jgi:hypothetical protein
VKICRIILKNKLVYEYCPFFLLDKTQSFRAMNEGNIFEYS